MLRVVSPWNLFTYRIAHHTIKIGNICATSVVKLSPKQLTKQRCWGAGMFTTFDYLKKPKHNASQLFKIKRANWITINEFYVMDAMIHKASR